MLETAISAFVTFFVVIDPVGMVPLFMAVVTGLDAQARKVIALKGCLAAAVILVLAGFAGDVALRSLGISIAAFRIAGGVLLLLLAVDMVFARHSGLRSTTEDEESESGQRTDIAYVPLAIPLIAGPGAFASVILLMENAGGNMEAQSLVMGMLLLVMVILAATLLGASRLMDWLGVTGINVMGRLFGIILAALSVQLIVDGLNASFPGLAG